MPAPLSLPTASRVAAPTNTPAAAPAPAEKAAAPAPVGDGFELTPANNDAAEQRARATSAALYRAMRGGVWGLGTQERALFAALEGASPQELERVRAHYQRHFGRDLDADIRGELSGLDRQRADALLAGQAARADAVALRQMFRSLRTPVGPLFALLESRLADGTLGAVGEAYEEQYAQALAEAVRGEVPRRHRARAAALVAGDKVLADVHLVDHLVGRHANRDRDYLLLQLLATGGPELAQRYEEVFGRPLAQDLERRRKGVVLQAAQAAIGGDAVGYVAARLRQLVRAPGTSRDRAVLSSLLTGTTEEERQAIRARFSADYPEYKGGLEQAVAEAKGSSVREMAEALLDDGQLSKLEAIHVSRHHPEDIILMGSLHSAEEMERLKAQYQQTYGQDLLKACCSKQTDGLTRRRLALALKGRPASLEEAVARLRELRDSMRAGANMLSRALVDWVAFSPQGRLLDGTLAELESALTRALEDGTIDEAEQAELASLLSYGEADVLTYREAQRRVADTTATLATQAALFATSTLTAGTTVPLMAQIAAMSAAGAATRTAAGAALQGSNATLRQAAIDAVLGAGSGLGSGGVDALMRLQTLTAMMPESVWTTFSVGGGAWDRKVALDWILRSTRTGNAVSTLAHRVLQGAGSGAVVGGVRGAATAVGDGKPLHQVMTQAGHQAGLGALTGAAAGALLGLGELALRDLQALRSLGDAEIEAHTRRISIDTPEGAHEVLVIGKVGEDQLHNVRQALQTLSDRTQGRGVAPLRTVHLFEMAEGVAGLAPSGAWPQHQGFALDPAVTTNAATAEEVVFHEMGHVLDGAGWRPISSEPLLGFGEGPFITAYASTNAREDFAENHMLLIAMMERGVDGDLPRGQRLQELLRLAGGDNVPADYAKLQAVRDGLYGAR